MVVGSPRLPSRYKSNSPSAHLGAGWAPWVRGEAHFQHLHECFSLGHHLCPRRHPLLPSEASLESSLS